MGAFTSIDEYAFHDARSTLWGWPGENPLRYWDPSGHEADIPKWAIPLLDLYDSPFARNYENLQIGAINGLTAGLSGKALGLATAIFGKTPYDASCHNKATVAGEVLGVVAGLALGTTYARGVAAASAAPSLSNVIHASEIAQLGAKEGTVVLGHYTMPVLGGIQETLPILEQAAAELGGETLSSLPADINAIAPRLESASRIVFYTSPGMQGLTAAEMGLIQSDAALLSKTVFVIGGF